MWQGERFNLACFQRSSKTWTILIRLRNVILTELPDGYVIYVVTDLPQRPPAAKNI